MEVDPVEAADVGRRFRSEAPLVSSEPLSCPKCPGGAEYSCANQTGCHCRGAPHEPTSREPVLSVVPRKEHAAEVVALLDRLDDQYCGCSPGGIRTRDLSLERAAS